MKRIASLSLVLFSVVSCSTQKPQSAETKSSDVAQVVAYEGKFYNKPDHKVDPSCDVYTYLQLEKISGGYKATLTNGLAGICELHVPENKRTYKIVSANYTECGSKIYRGIGMESELSILDHRERVCTDLVAADLILTETEMDGSKREFFAARPNLDAI